MDHVRPCAILRWSLWNVEFNDVKSLVGRPNQGVGLKFGFDVTHLRCRVVYGCCARNQCATRRTSIEIGHTWDGPCSLASEVGALANVVRFLA
jgi:hypothetical protein